jgi:hypothetical protein
MRSLALSLMGEAPLLVLVRPESELLKPVTCTQQLRIQVVDVGGCRVLKACKMGKVAQAKHLATRTLLPYLQVMMPDSPPVCWKRPPARHWLILWPPADSC